MKDDVVEDKKAGGKPPPGEPAPPPNTSNRLHAKELRTFIDAIERAQSEKDDLADHIRSIYASMSSRGFDVKYVRWLIKMRKKSPSERQEEETMCDLYLGAMGMRTGDLPLFAYVNNAGVDKNAMDSVVEALKQLAPNEGSIQVTVQGRTVTIFRTASGDIGTIEGALGDDEPPPEAMEPAEGAVPKRRKKKGKELDPAVAGMSEDEAEEAGRQAFRQDRPIIANPFPHDDPRRPKWDMGWRLESGAEDDDED